MTQFVDQLCKQIEQAARSNTLLRPVGGGTKNFYGGPLKGEEVHMQAWAGILEYEPTELVITAKAGTPLATIEAALAEHNQELAFEPPRFSAQSTLGGAIASGLAGPARLSRGGVKDYVLGCTLVDGRAQVLHFGGVVMKNVAGYDVSRVVPGSLGTLGIVLDLSIKVMPKSVAEATLQFEFNANQAIDQTNTWLGQALPISASHYQNGMLTLRLRGARAAVESATRSLGGERVPDGDALAFWTSLRDQTHPFFQGDADLWRIAVPPTTRDLPLEGEQMFEWGSGLRWVKPTAAHCADAIRGLAERTGGHATLYRTRDAAKRVHAFQAPAAPMLALQRRLKEQFDPAGIFSIDRLSPIL